MVRRSPCLLGLMLLGGCSSGTGGTVDDRAHAYVLINPVDTQQGWRAIATMRQVLINSGRPRPRSAGLIGTDSPMMYVDVVADCHRDEALIGSLRRAALTAGIGNVSCSPTLPGAL